VKVAKDIEGAGLILLVVPERRATDLNFFGWVKNVDVSEAFFFEPAKAFLEIKKLPSNDDRAEVTIGAKEVAFLADLLWRVDDKSDGKAVVFAGLFDEALAVFGANVGGVDYSEEASGQALFKQVVECIESVTGAGLVVLIITDKAAEEVGREDFGWEKVLFCQSGFTGTGGSYESDQRQFGDFDSSHWTAPARREKTAI
jgi:hypothetical protein